MNGATFEDVKAEDWQMDCCRYHSLTANVCCIDIHRYSCSGLRSQKSVRVEFGISEIQAALKATPGNKGLIN